MTYVDDSSSLNPNLKRERWGAMVLFTVTLPGKTDIDDLDNWFVKTVLMPVSRRLIPELRKAGKDAGVSVLTPLLSEPLSGGRVLKIASSEHESTYQIPFVTTFMTSQPTDWDTASRWLFTFMESLPAPEYRVQSIGYARVGA